MTENLVPSPPPPPFQLLPNHNRQSSTSNFRELWDHENELSQLICAEKQRNKNLLDPIFRYFRSVDPVMQQGPTCGIVALAMGLSNQKKSISVSELQKTANDRGWSNFGEMYSCEWMTELARSAGGNPHLIKGGLQNHLQCIADCLVREGSVLVPYDKDKDHSPGLFGGSMAHWALVTGLVCLECSQDENETQIPVSPCNCIQCPVTEKSSPQWQLAGCILGVSIVVTGSKIQVLPATPAADSYATPYVCAFQGNSRHLKVWPFLQLVMSNNNLNAECSLRKGLGVVPPGGVSAGLAGQAVLLMPNE